MSDIVLGLGGLLRDPACCVVRDGEILSAIEQAKVHHSATSSWFPEEAFHAALRVARVRAEEIGLVAVARPFADSRESERILDLRSRFPKAEIRIVEHHVAHAASAFFCSKFQRASVLSIDRAGDYRSAVLFEGHGTTLSPVREWYFPDSLGHLYNRVTELLGYKPRGDEHKVQWLSTSGSPLYKDLIGLDLLQQLPTDAKPDVAASLQEAVQESVCEMLAGAENVCLAGGLALNALLIRATEQRFGNVFVQPAAGNAGTALGAALYAGGVRKPLRSVLLGPEFTAAEIKQVLENCKLRFRFLLTDTELVDSAVQALENDQIIAWMQGRMEFGPRALGNRSILASPLNQYSTENLNIYIKHREPFRKFAASVPAEAADEYFEYGPNARFLATVGTVRPKYKDLLSAAVMGRDLIRVHTVSKSENPLFHALLTAAGKRSGVPILFNTSFNLFGDPLVCTPRDAVRGFYSSGIDKLFAGMFLVEK